MTELTVVLPTLNEAGNIGPLIRELRAVLPEPEFLVIDGESSDGTMQEARAAGARVIMNTRGYAASLMQGIRESCGERVLVLDADGSHSAADARKLWDARDGADLVVGSRYAPGGHSEGSATRRALSRVLAALFAWLVRLPARDVSSGFRLYRRAMFADAEVSARYFEVQPALLAWAMAKGARIKEVGIHYQARKAGRSKARVIRYGVAFLRQAWRLRH